MAQLIKLSDYVSRYEIDIYRYPSRYVRLKKERWQRLKLDWEARKKREQMPLWHSPSHFEVSQIKQKFNTWRRQFTKKEDEDVTDLPFDEQQDQSFDDLKRAFRDELFRFQMNWASSTISEISRVKKSYYYDGFLRFLAQELPDTVFVMYQPVCYLKKAPVDMDVILITPFEIWLIRHLKGNDQTIFDRESDRRWEKRVNDQRVSFMSPLMDLKRSRQVIEHLLDELDTDIPIRQAVISMDGYIDMSPRSTRIKLYDRRTLHEFKEQMLKSTAPIKSHQLKMADILLANSMTLSEIREDLEMDETDLLDDETDFRYD
ncbi:nuclease-related domain-containing protein [Salisediminibacterium beveridgei]|uniref:NERD domain-containing protein n=1 Tax=Salisediminibacterium beveridgei TaxID=632773 RepID=A0A1D7QSX8_9BACI|nr:nuclease-related domain-containing protein [Salisediminibacterium beveridgei]AOM82120.1 hypothetical protein BBEV_0749 [Salisediminibacterium beveridgei]